MRFVERAWARRLESTRRCSADHNLSGISETNRVRVPMQENASMYFHYSPVYSQFILYLYLYIYRHNLCRNKCYIYAQRNDRSFSFFHLFTVTQIIKKNGKDSRFWRNFVKFQLVIICKQIFLSIMNYN